MGEPYSNQKIRLITGESIYRETANLVGRCNNLQHPGFLIKSIIKRKQCLEKNCKHFEAFWEEPYWSGVKDREKQKAQKREEKKLALQQRRERQAQTLSLLEETMAFATWLSEAYDEPFVVTGVARISQASAAQKLIVNYVTDVALDDSDRYRAFGEMIAAHFQMQTELRHTRLPDGRYATMEDCRCYQKNRTG